MTSFGDRLISFGTAVVLALLVYAGVSLLFTYPSSADFCPSGLEFTTKEACTVAGGTWYDMAYPEDTPPYCGMWSCPQLVTALNNYMLYSSVVYVLLAFVFILIGVFAGAPAAISDGLFGGGILTLALASYVISVASVAAAIGMALITLVALIFTAYRRSKNLAQKK